MFNNSFLDERGYECLILLCRIVIAFRHKNNYLNIGVLPNGVFIDLGACNFVHAITSLHARFEHTRHRARNLSSHVYLYLYVYFFSNILLYVFFLIPGALRIYLTFIYEETKHASFS